MIVSYEAPNLTLTDTHFYCQDELFFPIQTPEQPGNRPYQVFSTVTVQSLREWQESKQKTKLWQYEVCYIQGSKWNWGLRH